MALLYILLENFKKREVFKDTKKPTANNDIDHYKYFQMLKKLPSTMMAYYTFFSNFFKNYSKILNTTKFL